MELDLVGVTLGTGRGICGGGEVVIGMTVFGGVGPLEVACEEVVTIVQPQVEPWEWFVL